LGVIIFTDNPTVHETQLVLGELRARGISTKFRAPWDFSLPEIPEYDADLVYAPSNMLNRGSTFELIHRHLILKELEERIGTVINPVDSLLSYSKGHLTLMMKKLGIPHPETLITENIDKAYHFAAGLLDSGKNVVLKPICKGRGVGVIRLDRIRSREDLLQFLAWYGRAHGQGQRLQVQPERRGNRRELPGPRLRRAFAEGGGGGGLQDHGHRRPASGGWDALHTGGELLPWVHRPDRGHWDPDTLQDCRLLRDDY
jgi:hypothetical protein